MYPASSLASPFDGLGRLKGGCHQEGRAPGHHKIPGGVLHHSHSLDSVHIEADVILPGTLWVVDRFKLALTCRCQTGRRFDTSCLSAPPRSRCFRPRAPGRRGAVVASPSQYRILLRVDYRLRRHLVCHFLTYAGQASRVGRVHTAGEHEVLDRLGASFSE